MIQIIDIRPGFLLANERKKVRAEWAKEASPMPVFACLSDLIDLEMGVGSRKDSVWDHFSFAGRKQEKNAA